jgi:hypothetical protein
MQEHGIDVENTYNMDEQGFHVGVAKRGKGVFSKASLGPKAAVQDGNREWLTLLACVCASGESLPPVLVYQGTSGIQSGWVDAIEVGKHKIFFSNSESGWSNNDIDLAWLEQVFERFTKRKRDAVTDFSSLTATAAISRPSSYIFATAIASSWLSFHLIQPTAYSRSTSCSSDLLVRLQPNSHRCCMWLINHKNHPKTLRGVVRGRCEGGVVYLPLGCCRR